MGIETKYYTNANEPKSLGLASAAVGQIPKIKAVDGNGVPMEWEATDMASELLIVKITDNNGTLSADKTFIEIRDAIIAGIPVLVGYFGTGLPLIAVSADALFFGVIGCANDETGAMVSTNIIEITQNGKVNDISAAVDTMPNPNAITFTGAVTGSYNGSTPLTVNIPTVPTKTSQLTNDSGFLTSHQSLAAYRTAASQDEIDSGKVDKENGKGLSTNDYTAAAKAKVDAIPENPKYTDTVYDDTALKERVATIEGKESEWDAKSDFSGNYNDLTNKPTIPTALPNPNAITFTGAVTDSYDGSAPVTINIPESGAGNMKKLTFTGAVTGEYDGTTDVNVDIPSDVYVINFDNHGILVNNFDELVNAIKSHKIIVIQEGHAVYTMHEVGFNFDNSNNIENVVLCFINEIIFGIGIIDRNTKEITVHYFDLPVFDRSTLSASGAVYYDKHTQKFVIKDTTPPIATTSTAGTIKVGNGLSISADGTLSVTTATYYTGTADPVNTLGADGDLYLKTEG